MHELNACELRLETFSIDNIAELWVDEDKTCGRDFNAMLQRLSLEVVVQERRTCTNRPQSKPNPDKEVAISKINSHNLLRLNIKSLLQICPIANSDIVYFLIGP